MMEGVRNKNIFLLKFQGNCILYISLMRHGVLAFMFSVFKLFVMDSAQLFIYFGTLF